MPAPETAPTLAPPPAALLPVRAVTLFLSGVAYLLREGEVPAGDVSVPLTFRTAQVSDLLKSLVLLDETGSVRPAVYPSRDPIGRALQAFSVNVSENRSRADLLRSLRGVSVRVQTFAGETVEGRVVGVETRDEYSAERETLQSVETVTLLTGEGIVAVDLPRVRVLRLLDERLAHELESALQTLASGTDDDRRTITLGFSGAAARTVRVGYLAESPLWKVSYRLVLSEAVEGKLGSAYLQGWAMVENTSDEDWSAVELSLVSGRPSSFVQDLYAPLYVPRPMVAPDVQTSPMPQLHGGNMMPTVPSSLSSLSFGEAREEEMAYAAAMPAPAPTAGGMARSRSMVANKLALTVPAQAKGESTGELFAYAIETPVTLPRQNAAMIPIVSRENVPVEKLSLYSPYSGDSRTPWNAVRLVNNTDLHLKGGPVTLFDGGTYAGEARTEDVPPGDSRLLTYALDMMIEGDRQGSEANNVDATTLLIQSGVLTAIRARERTTVYTLKNKAREARRVLVEQPLSAGWELVSPAAAERTAQVYRFEITLAPGESQTLPVLVSQPVSQEIRLMDATVDTVAAYVSSGTVPVRIKNALRPILEVRRRMDELTAEVEVRNTELASIHAEQGRLRENLAAVEKNTPLYRRFLADLEKQEDRLNVLYTETAARNADRASEEARLREYIAGIEVL